MHHRWEVLGRDDIDDQSADDLTSQVISMASAGMKAIIDARTAAAQPEATPRAGNSSGSE